MTQRSDGSESQDTRPASVPSPGAMISHYRIIEKTGEGGMGVVFKAEDTKLGRLVAIKFLPRHSAVTAESRERFEREARAAAALSHPNIATVHAIEEADDAMFIVMEYIDGQELRAVLGGTDGEASAQPLPLGDVLHYGIQIARGLQAAHEKGIVHRDIKPENVMIDPKGQAKIMDFGLARMIGGESVTGTGVAIGTVAYMSPEQTRGETLDARTDIWSWGVVFYEMLAGRNPFRRDHPGETIHAILNHVPEALWRYRPETPAGLEAIVRKATAKDPADRYLDCGQLLRDLRVCAQSILRDTATLSVKTTTTITVAGGQLRTWLDRRLLWPVRRLRSLRLPWVLAATVIVLGAVGIYVFVPRRPSEHHAKKIAVLPFANISADPEYEYFSDGVTEDILTELVKIGDLRVISRATMMRYKGSRKTLRELGEELGVSVVLEGSVRKEADRVRITAQLIDVNTDEHIWADTYDRGLEHVLDIQREIAQRIAEALHAELSDSERRQLQRRTPSNPEAYNLFLEGKAAAARGGPDDVAIAVDKYRQALMINSNDSRIWAALAASYARQGDIGMVSTDEAYAKARQAAEKALTIDDELPYGHSAMAIVKTSYDWDWEGAEAELRRALDLAPGSAIIINQLAELAMILGRIDEAISLSEKACDLDPVSVARQKNLGLRLMFGGRLNEAIRALERAIELNPSYPASHSLLGEVYLLKGDLEMAISQMEMEPDEGWRLHGLALVQQKAAVVASADSALGVLIEKYQDDSAFQIAEIYAYRGDNDHAFEWLERAYTQRDGGLTSLKNNPLLRGIEKDPRYAPFMKQMGLPL